MNRIIGMNIDNGCMYRFVKPTDNCLLGKNAIAETKFPNLYQAMNHNFEMDQGRKLIERIKNPRKLCKKTTEKY